MVLLSMVKNPTPRQLRQFGCCALVALPLLGWWWFGTGKPAAFGALLAAGGLFGLAAVARPKVLQYPFLGLMLLTAPIGLVVSEIVLVLVYLLVFTPMATLFRVVSRDALQRKIDRQASSYWQRKAQPRGVESYFRQF